MTDFEKMGFRSYRLWLAMRNHFNVAKMTYHPTKTNVKPETFLKRRDKPFFSRLGNRYDDELEQFYISVFCRVGNGKLWVGEMLTDIHDKEFKDWTRRTQTRKKTFRDDVATIAEYVEGTGTTLKGMFKSNGGKLPAIVQLESKRLITPESLVIINKLTDFTDHIYCVHPAWEDVKLRLTKYGHFVKIKDLTDYVTALRTVPQTIPKT